MELKAELSSAAWNHARTAFARSAANRKRRNPDNEEQYEEMADGGRLPRHLRGAGCCDREQLQQR